MKTLIACLLAGALGLVACGGGSGSSSVAVSVRTATTAALVPETSTATSPLPTTVPPPSTDAPTTQPTVVAATATPSSAPSTAAAPAITVVQVVDGDTVDLSTGERVRIIGIDTPERGSCGFQEAADALAAMVTGKGVVVSAGARDDVDKYGRILRYLDVDGVDVGLTLIQQGLAIARYDSRDGYGHHPREETYIEADAASTSVCVPPPPSAAAGSPATTSGSAYYANCAAARAAGVAPLYEGEPGYRTALDRDHDGVACE